jgi:2-polyprenyl-6-methoxyphenol hydroxylase-like FAD-dependent oxidoreductase
VTGVGGRSFDVAVLGAGPAGLIAALRLARDRDVALVADRLPRDDDPPRVDAVPAAIVALLVELGIAPGALGVDRLHDQRWIAWSPAGPRARRLSPAAHLERPRLEQVLLAELTRHPRVAVFVSKAWTRADGIFWGDGWRAARLIDATGRAAVTADAVTRLPRPWAARTLWARRAGDARGPAFALAALPDGYAYRIGAARAVVVGFVGRGFMIDDLPPLASFAEGRAATASVQWATSASTAAPRPFRIGDAALARDPLSSQGIAAAAAEAMLVASVESAADVELFERRQREQRRAHLHALHRMIGECAFAEEPAWRDYSRFVAPHAGAPTETAVGLRGGKIVEVSPSS